MRPYSNILYYVDVHEPAIEDLEQALRAAETSSAAMTFASVVDMVGRRPELYPRHDLETLESIAVEEQQEKLSALVKPFASRPVSISTKVLIGEPATAVIEAVLADGYDLVIKAPAGSARRRMDATEMRLLRGCPCAVNITRPGEQEHFQRMLVAVDVEPARESLSAMNHAILQAAAAIQQVAFPELHIVHAWSLYGESLLTRPRIKMKQAEIDRIKDEERSLRQESLDELLRDYEQIVSAGRKSLPAPSLHLVQGQPAEVISRVAEEIDAQLLVLSTASRRRLRGFLMGNTAEAVLNMVDCSVLTIKPEGFVSPLG